MSTTDSNRGSRGIGLVVALLVGVALTAFFLLDPFDVHSLDERLRADSSDAATAGGNGGESTLYTCGMHPNVIESEPGTCPICQMDLVPLEHSSPEASDQEEAPTWSCPVHEMIEEPEVGECPICGRDLVSTSASPAGPEISIDSTVIQKMNVRIAGVERRDLSRRIRTVGHLDYNEERMVTVTTRTSGFVKQVHVNHLGQPVRRGEPLVEIDAPELVQTQRELLAAVDYARRLESASPEARQRAEALVDAARARLEYWEIPREQIAAVEAGGEILPTFTIEAPVSGVVMRRPQGLEGMAVQPGAELLHIVDLDSLWLRVEIYEHQLPWLDVGSEATVRFDYLPDESFTGRVRYIEPEVSPTTRTVALTLEVPNRTGRLRVGMYATVTFAPVIAADALAVPSQSVIRSGDRDIAVVALGGGRFAPREVVLGAESEGWIEVVQGLTDGDEIVVSAQFLIDSESNLRAAIATLLAERGGHDH